MLLHVWQVSIYSILIGLCQIACKVKMTKNMLASETCRFNVYTCIVVCMQQLKPVEGISCMAGPA